jgi:hypothetical protein
MAVDIEWDDINLDIEWDEISDEPAFINQDINAISQSLQITIQGSIFTRSLIGSHPNERSDLIFSLIEEVESKERYIQIGTVEMIFDDANILQVTALTNSGEEIDLKVAFS